LKAWLIRVTVNASKSLLRSAWFRRTVPLSEHEAPCAEDSPDTVGAVMSLPEKYRSVVLLYYYEDYPVREIAQLLRRTETAVQTQLQRARAMLKEKLKEDWQDE
jgi:RNA polymerase sigma-70 factor (ECF subfamily)